MKDFYNNSFSPEFIQQLKSKNDIISLISKYVHLEKKGKNFWGCCPFHHEKTPSFCVNEYDGFYHCFGCGESGDIISFLRKYEDLSYYEAVSILAENANMKIPRLNDDEKYIKTKRTKEHLLLILNLTREFYKNAIYNDSAKIAQTYLKSRNTTRASLQNFELGFSPNFNDLPNFLAEKGFSPEEMKLAGVCEIGKNGKPYDFLFERLIFPIVNVQNDCIGFSGRDLSKNANVAKYKNTPATMLFDKSKTVYAINLIKKLKKSFGLNNIIIVEGQFDVVSMHQAGFENTVACLGTALTKDHIKELKRFCDNIVLCFDGDEAGQKAILRALNTFEDYGDDVNVRVVRLPENLDPDEFLKKYGSQKLKDLIDNAVNPIIFKINNIKEKCNLNNPEGKVEFTKNALKILARLKSNAEQDIYLGEIKKETNLSLDYLRRDLQNIKSLLQKNNFKNLENSEEIGDKISNNILENNLFGEIGGQSAIIKAERFVVASLLHHMSYAVFNDEVINSIQNPSLKKLVDILFQKYKNNEKFLVSYIFDLFDVDSEPNIKAVANFDFNIIQNPEEYFKECEYLIYSSSLKFKKDQLSKQYSQEISTDKKIEILKQINLLTKNIQNLEKQKQRNKN